MSEAVVVLKFGSSVLPDESALPAVVLEICREVRRNRRVVAVVSAFGDTTDTLLAAAHRVSERPEAYSLARLLETGEARTAAVLGLALAAAGVRAEVSDARGVGLRTAGPILDAEPCGLDTGRLRRILATVPVVIVPGFCGVDPDGRTTLLGRGGSDLTALFLARQLDAVECRLLKDVAGLLQVHPDGTLDHASRYATAHYDECLRVGGPLIQPKAVEFAARGRQTFTIARCGGAGGTVAGPYPSRFEAIEPEPRRLKVALAGLGTVGLGVLRWLQSLSADFEVTGILVRQASAPRPADVPAHLLTEQWSRLLDDNPDLIIEVIGGTDTAAALIRAARGRGIGVVTANKQLLALDTDLLAAAVDRDSLLYAGASVGGNLPALEHAALLADAEPVTRVVGVLNGTCNYVLEQVQAGVAIRAAVAEAQQLGLAEADPHLDLSGLDCVYKLALLAATAFGEVLAPGQIRCRGLDGLAAARVDRVRHEGKVLKLVAEARRRNGRLEGTVAVRALDPAHPLAACSGEENCLLITTASGATHRVEGKGAGRWPTTCAVVADALEARRRLLAPGQGAGEASARSTGS